MTNTEALAAQCARLFFSVGGGHEIAPIREHQLAAVCESAITLATLQFEKALTDLLLVIDTSPGIEATAKAVAEARRLTAK